MNWPWRRRPAIGEQLAAELRALRESVKSQGEMLERTAKEAFRLRLTLEDARQQLAALQAEVGKLSARAEEEIPSGALHLIAVSDAIRYALQIVQRFEATVPREETLNVLAALYQRSQEELGRLGVEVTTREGVPFDPHLHEAVAAVPHAELAGRVLAVERDGYRLGSRVIRTGRVVVGTLPAQEVEKPAEGVHHG